MIAARDWSETSAVRPSSVLDQPSSEGPSEVLSRLGMDQNVTCMYPVSRRCVTNRGELHCSRLQLQDVNCWLGTFRLAGGVFLNCVRCAPVA